jgi:predicted nucleotidyltransferase
MNGMDNMTIENRIDTELSAIEEKENLTILLAVESGSRAWGFASPDSDYDVRFIYVRPREHYLRLDKHRDVCEWLLDDILDINGWDFDKTLRLLHSSNPTLFEWINSPIVYRKHPEFESLMGSANKYFLSKPGLHHYLHMAEGNYREYLKGETVKLKKYFYVLRPILACRHILANGTPPPMRFSELLETQMERSLIPEIDELLAIKESSSEMGTAPKRQVINDYIEKSLGYIDSQIKKLPASQRRNSWAPLNRVFLQALDLVSI